MSPLRFLQEMRGLFIKTNTPVSKLEMTSGNYDDCGNLIKTNIPSITTELCEIGIFNNTAYFVVIISSNTFHQTLFNSLKILPNIKIYGFKDFLKILYPTSNFFYKDFEREVRGDTYLQIQFSYKYNSTNPKILHEEYEKIKKIFNTSTAHVINQLDKTL